MQDTALQQAIQAWEALSNDPKVREEYFARQKALLDESSALIEAEARGWDKGILATARAMIAKGLSDELISEITHLTTEQIRNLKQ